MTIKAIQYLVNETTAAMQLPNSDADCCTVIAIKPVDFTWGPGDLGVIFGHIDRDITTQEEEDMLMRRKAISRASPAGDLIATHPNDHNDYDPNA